MREGRWIVFEGPDGTGKDTIIKLVCAELSKQGRDFVSAKDPSPRTARKIREILLNDEGLENSTQLFLYIAARCELFNKEILPALEQGKIVLCNRYELSTYCYQGLYFTRQEIDLISRIGGLAERKPDLQIVYLSRRSFRDSNLEDVMGKFCRDHREQILEKYIEYAKEAKLKIRLVQVDGKTVEDIFNETWKILCDVL